MYLDNECVRLFEECFLMNFSLSIMYSTLILKWCSDRYRYTLCHLMSINTKSN